jgi:hypothetical protein
VGVSDRGRKLCTKDKRGRKRAGPGREAEGDASLSTVRAEVVNSLLCKKSHQVLLILAVSLWTRLYISRSSRINFVIFSTAWRTVV